MYDHYGQNIKGILSGMPFCFYAFLLLFSSGKFHNFQNLYVWI